MDILNSYIKLDTLDYRIKKYISNLISNSNVYTLDIDPVDNNDGYFGFSKFPDNTIKSCIFYESQIEGKTRIPALYFIANLEENSIHSDDALYNLRKHIMIGPYSREQFDLERGNRIYHEPKEPDPDKDGINDFLFEKYKDSDLDIKSDIIGFKIPEGYQVDGCKLFTCRSTDLTDEENNKVFLKFKLKKG